MLTLSVSPLQAMNFSLIVAQPQWRVISTIPKGVVLPKGRKNELYRAITGAAANVTERFGCYSWGDETNICYCGSFAQDYASGNFVSNLQGRVHNYLQNHRLDTRTGRKNTNLMVFENINTALKKGDVILRLFIFESLQIGNEKVDFVTFAENSYLVQATEQLLICSYRRKGQCQWNRT